MSPQDLEKLKEDFLFKEIRINRCNDPYVGSRYEGRTGIVRLIDDIGQLHGDWGGVALIKDEDDFEVI